MSARAHAEGGDHRLVGRAGLQPGGVPGDRRGRHATGGLPARGHRHRERADLRSGACRAHRRPDDAVSVSYYSNEGLALVSEAWLGPNYRVTSQINVVTRAVRRNERSFRRASLRLQNDAMTLTRSVDPRYHAGLHNATACRRMAQGALSPSSRRNGRPGFAKGLVSCGPSGVAVLPRL